MLLFGLILLSTVLAVENDLATLRVKVCIQNGKVKSLRIRMANETETNDCSSILVNHYTGSVLLDIRDITGFEKGWYQLQDYPIKELDLRYNKIVEITSEMLNDLPSGVKSVKLWGNKIKRLRKGIIENKYLSSMDLGYNYIRKIENGALENMNLTEILDLNHNRLNNTEFAATLPPNLEELDLSRNIITEISPGSFSKLDKLRRLDLHGNRITTIKRQSFQGLENLRYLDVMFNFIQNVENGAFQFNSLLRKTILYENL